MPNPLEWHPEYKFMREKGQIQIVIIHFVFPKTTDFSLFVFN